MKRIICIAAVAFVGALVSGCESDADKVSENISKEAEQFKTFRRIVGVNGITDKVLFEVTGRCSVDEAGTLSNTLAVTCKEAPSNKPSSYKKHYIGRSDNVAWISTQLKPSKVSPYRTTVIIKPENIVPNLDLVTGQQK